ncbi:uncharacterized protein V1518DRAFT_455048 [Limtongia smithiae]|uniref:uncharacterized protein n=1 Tax=Limtongia smithiae TaxID=1125753 RepID=UPI0034CEF083
MEVAQKLGITADTSTTHIVAYYIEDATIRSEIIEKVKSLKDRALKDGQPYILESRAGEALPFQEGRDGGFNIVTATSFKNVEDRLYYSSFDPAHEELKNLAAMHLKKGLILDFAL